jgi:hypothetical protein
MKFEMVINLKTAQAISLTIAAGSGQKQRIPELLCLEMVEEALGSELYSRALRSRGGSEGPAHPVAAASADCRGAGPAFTASPALPLATGQLYRCVSDGLVMLGTNTSATAKRAGGSTLSRRWRAWRTGALRPQGIPKVVPLGAEVRRGAIDRFQEHQQIRLL